MARSRKKYDDEEEESSLAIGTRRRVREGFLILISATAIYFLIALLSYHTSDPGWSNAGQGGFVANSGGKVGAWFADVFFYLFGFLAYLFPIMLATAAGLMYREHQLDEEFSFRNSLLRSFGFFLVLLSSCGLVSLNFQHLHTSLPFHGGGVLGSVVSVGLTSILNLAGTDLLLIAFFLAGITLFTGLSWLFLLECFGKGVLFGLGWLRDLYLDWRYGEYEEDEEEEEEEEEPVKKKKKKVAKEPELKVKPKPEIKIKPTIAINHAHTVIPVDPNLVGTLPSLSLLDPPKKTKSKGYSQSELEALSEEVEKRLLDFGIEVTVVAVNPGPVITRFELDLAPGLKVSKITSLSKDLARALSVSRVRVVEVIPGKSYIGIEIPNQSKEIVNLREVLQTERFTEASSVLSIALGKDIAGYPVVVDLAKMPHLLVAGTTGSGKSVSINTMILSILYREVPDQVRLILVDPKMLELSVYEGIPHLLTPVVTDMKEAANAFRWCVAEMERRYRLMASLGVRNLAGYNAKIKKAIAEGKPIPDPFKPDDPEIEARYLEPLPYIVLIVDELADMMMMVGKKVEELIARIAQKARAAGIHMILATQRPSVDVITGLIKANIPTRMSFQVSSRIDSRTILDQQGAEQLLGYGDMLYLPPGSGHPIRVHGAYVSDEEVHRVVADWKKRGQPNYLEEVLQGSDEAGGAAAGGGDGDAEVDALYDQAVAIVTETRRASISYVQRRLKIGYNRAARILEEMENAGVVTPMESNGSREVLAPPPPED